MPATKRQRPKTLGDEVLKIMGQMDPDSLTEAGRRAYAGFHMSDGEGFESLSGEEQLNWSRSGCFVFISSFWAMIDDNPLIELAATLGVLLPSIKEPGEPHD